MEFTDWKESLQRKKCKNCRGRCKENINCLIAYNREIIDLEEYIHQGLKHFGVSREMETGKRMGVIGLRNLGATCYLNTLLENWFYLESFRDGILTFNGTDPIIYELQKAFLYLKESKRSSYNPKSFIDSMNLDYSVQQDVPEFTKLLLSKLDYAFQESDDLKGFVDLHFKGHLVYQTTCMNCKKVSPRNEEFLELELSLTDSLNESFQKLLSKELLTDSNMYACGNCSSLQDAIREIKLKSLPSVLNIQLLRFVFDTKTFTKKKLKTKTRFTKTLDFSGMVQGESQDLVYDLHAVLLHRGQSANSGHYVIRVFNQEDNSWYDLDDDTVTKMETVSFELYSGLTSGESTRKNAVKKTSTNLENDEYESSSVYVLTYVKRSFKNQTKSSDVDISSKLLMDLEADNKEFENRMVEYSNSKNALSNEYTRKFNSFTDLVKSQDSTCDTGPSVFVDANLLKILIKDEFKCYEPIETKLPSSLNLFQTTTACCKHELVRVDSIYNLKLISRKYLTLLEGMGCTVCPLLSVDDICESCFNEQMMQKNNSKDHLKHISVFKSKSKKGDSGDYLISKAWLQEWKRKVPRFASEEGNYPGPFDEPYRYDVFCEHGGIKFDQEKATWISRETFEYLQSLFPKIERVQNDHPTCLECSSALESGRKIKKELQLQKNIFPTLYNSNQISILSGENYSLISSEFRTRWVEYMQGNLSIPPQIDNSALLCSVHNLLLFDMELDRDNESFVLVPEKEWIDLKSFYEGGPEISVCSVLGDDSFFTSISVCQKCRNERISDYKDAIIIVQNITGKKMNYITDSSKTESCNSEFEDQEQNTSSQSKGKKKNVRKESIIKKRFKIDDDSTPRRQSKRIRNTDLFEVKIQKSMTLRKLKLKIMSLVTASPSYQKLCLNGKVLDDDEKTMDYYSIKPNDILTMEILEEDESNIKAFCPEAGFSGTGLLQPMPDRDGIMSDNLSMIDTSVLIWECQQCTFLNTNRETCEMCNLDRIDVISD